MDERLVDGRPWAYPGAALALYNDWDSIQSTKTRFCLGEKQLPFESRIVSLQRFENLAPAYLALNPQGVVPTLQHGAHVIVESSTINEYVDAIGAGDRLLPDDPVTRVRVRLWCRYEDKVMHPSVRPPTFHLMIKQRYAAMTPEQMGALVDAHPQPQRAHSYRTMATGPIDYEAILESLASFRTILARMERALGRRAWLADNRFTLADIAAAAFIDRIEALGMAWLWAALPRVNDWVLRLQARPAYGAAMPPAGKRMPCPSEAALAEVRQRLAS